MNDYGDEYHALIELAENFGLDIQQLSNIEAIIPKLIKEWKGSRRAPHLFITLVEKAIMKKQIEKQLEKIRLNSAERSKFDTKL